MRVLPSTVEKVRLCTNKKVNRKIREKSIREMEINTDQNDDYLSCRIKKLNREWDTERFLEANASLIIFGGSLMGLFTKSKNNTQNS